MPLSKQPLPYVAAITSTCLTRGTCFWGMDTSMLKWTMPQPQRARPVNNDGARFPLHTDQKAINKKACVRGSGTNTHEQIPANFGGPNVVNRSTEESGPSSHPNTAPNTQCAVSLTLVCTTAQFEPDSSKSCDTRTHAQPRRWWDYLLTAIDQSHHHDSVIHNAAVRPSNPSFDQQSNVLPL